MCAVCMASWLRHTGFRRVRAGRWAAVFRKAFPGRSSSAPPVTATRFNPPARLLPRTPSAS